MVPGGAALDRPDLRYYVASIWNYLASDGRIIVE
jgi:hypothetical protein